MTSRVVLSLFLICLFHNVVSQIGDFGISCFADSFGSQTKSAVGNPRWRAPEITRGETYSEKADIYSFGLIIWELFTGEVPFAELDPIRASLKGIILFIFHLLFVKHIVSFKKGLLFRQTLNKI